MAKLAVLALGIVLALLLNRVIRSALGASPDSSAGADGDGEGPGDGPERLVRCKHCGTYVAEGEECDCGGGRR